MRDVVQNNTPFVILALNLNDRGRECTIMHELFDGRFKELEGCYKGVVENSYLVTVPEWTIDGLQRLDKVIDLARQFNQESILLVSQKREASLLYLHDNQPEKLVKIGDFEAITQWEARELDSWTFDRVANQFWAVR